MLNESELPKLPDGWKWRLNPGRYKFVALSYDGSSVTIIDGDVCDLFIGGAPFAPAEVVLAVLFANGVTLPDVPGHSTILGGK